MTTRLPFLLLLLALAALLGGQVSVAGQTAAEPIEGRVVERGGVPIPSARVELWSGSRLLASTRSDAGGAFLLQTDDPRSPAWILRVDRLGYGAVELSLPTGLTPVEVVLEPAPIPLGGFEVEGDRDYCAAREDRTARTLWTEAAGRAFGGLDTLGIASYTHLRVDTLGGVAMGAPGMAGAEVGQRSSAPLLRLSWDRRVQLEGYAFPLRRIDTERSYASWGYPPLEADFAAHFATEAFGRLHTFQVQEAAPGGWILHFCGRRRDDPYLEGSMEIGPDTLIHRVEWSFRTPDPDEGAGGWAAFPPPESPGDNQLLLPSESVTWKSLPGGEIVRRAQWYEGWIRVPGDSVPLLPLRIEGENPPVR